MFLGRLIEMEPTSDIFTRPHLKGTEESITGYFGGARPHAMT